MTTTRKTRRKNTTAAAENSRQTASGSGAEMEMARIQNGADSRRLRWRRNLYEKTGLPDNYAPDDCFLAAIRRNRDVRRYNFKQCAPMACLVSLQVSAAVAFYAAYAALGGAMAQPDTILELGGAAAAIGYLASAVCGKRTLTASVLLVDLKHLAVFSSFGIGLSPVLYRLTDTISTDTIHTTSFLALLTHLLTHDYLPASPTAAHYASGNALSLNASLFAAVCLASRLDSALEAFSLLALSVVAFVLCPLLRSRVVDTDSTGATLTLTGTLTLAAGSSLLAGASVSNVFAAITCLSHVLIVLLAPWLFVRWQDYKDTINGPWDEAVPNI